MRAREGLPDQLTAASFHPPPSLSPPTPAVSPFAPEPASREPDESSCSNAGGETAIKLARTTDYLLFRPPSGFPARAAPCRFSEETKLPETPPRLPPPFNLEKFQRLRISGALERTDWPRYQGAKTKD